MVDEIRLRAHASARRSARRPSEQATIEPLVAAPSHYRLGGRRRVPSEAAVIARGHEMICDLLDGAGEAVQLLGEGEDCVRVGGLEIVGGPLQFVEEFQAMTKLVLVS